MKAGLAGLRELRADLVEKLSAVDRVLGMFEGTDPVLESAPPLRTANGKAPRQAKVPRAQKVAADGNGFAVRPCVVSLLKNGSGLSSIELKSRVQKAGGPQDGGLIQAHLGSMKTNGLLALSGDGIWTLTPKGREWKPRGVE